MTRLIDANKLWAAMAYDQTVDQYCYPCAERIWKAIKEQPTVDAIPITFERFRFVCRFFNVGCNEDRQIEFTCRRKDMIPEGCSWGICDKEHCPYMKGEEE